VTLEAFDLLHSSAPPQRPTEVELDDHGGGQRPPDPEAGHPERDHHRRESTTRGAERMDLHEPDGAHRGHGHVEGIEPTPSLDRAVADRRERRDDGEVRGRGGKPRGERSKRLADGELRMDRHVATAPRIAMSACS
jgi:hypothetical protein